MKLPPEILTGTEVRLLLDACSRRCPTGIRNRALIAVLYRTGLRISEALALRRSDVDGDAGTVRVLHGKGDKARTVGLDPGGFGLLDLWLVRRSRLYFHANGHTPLFCTLKGGPINSSYIRRLLPRLAAKTGIAKRVHAHGLRHTHAAELAAENVPVNVIQRQLGHSSLTTTSEYLNHVAPQDVISAMQGRVWHQLAGRDGKGSP